MLGARDKVCHGNPDTSLSESQPCSTACGRCLEICEARGAAEIAFCATAAVNRPSKMSENGSGTPSRSPSIADSTNDSRWRNHGGGRCHSTQAVCFSVGCCSQFAPASFSRKLLQFETVCLAGKASPSSGKCYLRPLHRDYAPIMQCACLALFPQISLSDCAAQGFVCVQTVHACVAEPSLLLITK